MKHCINCGNQLENNEIFCTNCGTKQQEQHPPSPEVKQEHQPPQKNKKLSKSFSFLSLHLLYFYSLVIKSLNI